MGEAVRLHLPVGVGFTALSAFLLWPITGGDYPPGVDTPTFLHLSWVAELAVTGQLPDLLEDPYWYGGFFYLVYPPLSYGLVGVLSAVTSANFVDVYSALLIISYGALGYSTWFLAREFGLRWWSACLAGLFATLAYPALSSVFLWGWFSSVMAMPFALLSFALLERSLRRLSWRLAVVGGGLMAAATLTHHMTGLAVCLGLVVWFAYHVVMRLYPRRDLLVHSFTAGVTTIILIAPWAIPFLVKTTEVGFRREIPGNWLSPLGLYFDNVLDPSVVGVFIYPSYLGVVLTALALVGGFIAVMEARRLATLALVLVALVWFSMGANANPLINYYPISSLDVGRFQFYMVPFLAILAAVAVERLLTLIRRSWPGFRSLLIWRSLAVAALLLVLTYPGYTAWRARSLAEPYRIQPQVQQALDWLNDTPLDGEGNPPKVFGVGLWNWHSFLVPTLANRPLIDGWHDEGAANVDLIRRLRRMAWIGGDPVDPTVAHGILTTLGADYVLLHRSYWRGERGGEYWDQFQQRPELFELRGQWGDVGVFGVLSSKGLITQ